jgi:hypothetical protein
MMRRLVVMALAVLVWGSKANDAVGETPDEAFAEKFVPDYFAARFTSRPSQGTAAGLHLYDEMMEDLSRAAIERRIGELKTQRETLRGIERAKLSFANQIDAAVLEGQIEGELLDLEVLKTWQNPMAYAGLPGEAADVLIKREFAPAKERLKAVIARERQIPALFEAARANVENPPREFTDLAIRMAQGSVGFFKTAVPAWARSAAGSDAKLRSEFDAANGAVVKSFEEFAAWLEEDVKTQSKGAYAIGAENFSNKLKYDEIIDRPLSEVLARGELNLQKDYDAFVATAKSIDPAKTPAEVMKSLSDDHPTAEDLIPSVRRSVEAARAFLIERGIATVPSEVRCRIEETPPYARSGGFASMDTPGPFETKATEAFYYVTPVEPDWDAAHKEEHLRLFNGPVVAMINVHEAYPGHYLQFLYAPRFPTMTRKLTFCGTNVEGWAHYTEQMMVDEGFGGGDPKIRLAQLQEALLRDCRYVAGIKLHTEGWTVEQAAKLFEEKGFQEPANAYEEARRGAYNPTYLYYTYGKLDVLDLRDEYLKRKPGATLKEFHDAFVSQGGLPIPLVRRVLLR